MITNSAFRSTSELIDVPNFPRGLPREQDYIVYTDKEETSSDNEFSKSFSLSEGCSNVVIQSADNSTVPGVTQQKPGKQKFWKRMSIMHSRSKKESKTNVIPLSNTGTEYPAPVGSTRISMVCKFPEDKEAESEGDKEEEEVKILNQWNKLASANEILKCTDENNMPITKLPTSLQKSSLTENIENENYITPSIECNSNKFSEISHQKSYASNIMFNETKENNPPPPKSLTGLGFLPKNNSTYDCNSKEVLLGNRNPPEPRPSQRGPTIICPNTFCDETHFPKSNAEERYNGTAGLSPKTLNEKLATVKMDNTSNVKTENIGDPPMHAFSKETNFLLQIMCRKILQLPTDTPSGLRGEELGPILIEVNKILDCHLIKQQKELEYFNNMQKDYIIISEENKLLRKRIDNTNRGAEKFATAMQKKLSLRDCLIEDGQEQLYSIKNIVKAFPVARFTSNKYHDQLSLLHDILDLPPLVVNTECTYTSEYQTDTKHNVIGSDNPMNDRPSSYIDGIQNSKHHSHNSKSNASGCKNKINQMRGTIQKTKPDKLKNLEYTHRQLIELYILRFFKGEVYEFMTRFLEYFKTKQDNVCIDGYLAQLKNLNKLLDLQFNLMPLSSDTLQTVQNEIHDFITISVRDRLLGQLEHVALLKTASKSLSIIKARKNSRLQRTPTHYVKASGDQIIPPTNNSRRQ